MKLQIREYCIRCGMCEDLHPQLFKLNTEADKVDILYDEIPAELEEDAKKAIADCAITAIFKDGAQTIQEINRIGEDLEVDVAVMGSGLAGFTAAVTLARKGVKVAVFEKRPFQGGSVSNTPIAFGNYKSDNRSRAKAFKEFFDMNHYNANPDVIRSFINDSSRIPEFIEFIGEKMIPVGRGEINMKLKEAKNKENIVPEDESPRDSYIIKGRGNGHGAAVVIYKCMQKLRELGGELYLDSPVVDLIRDGNKVVGLVAKNNQTGQTYNVKAGAVIIASGGFPEDREMVKQYTGHTFTDEKCSNGGNVLFNYFPGSRLTGDGHKLAWAAGGAKGSMGINGHNLVPGPGIIGNTPWVVFNETRTIQEQPYLWVNQNGERFIDETQSRNHLAMGTSISNQPQKCGYILFDEDTKLHMENEGVEFLYFIFPVPKLTNVTGQFEKLINEIHNEHVFMADTLEELCAQTGIDFAGLTKTLENYNRYCDEGFDEQYFKDAAYLRPVRRGKFYALRVFCGGYSTTGGIKINGDCAVVDENGRAIPGLYSAGDCACGEIFGNPPTGGMGNATISMSQGFTCADKSMEYIGK